MNFTRRRLLHLAGGAAALPGLSRTAGAQAYPSRYLRLIVPFAPGGGFDAVAHPLAIGFPKSGASKWSSKIGQAPARPSGCERPRRARPTAIHS